jgi:L-galactose dehydrogenase
VDYQPLGRTGLTVSAIGLGTGGPSHVGLRTGRTTEESVAVVRAAIDNGINFIDTAEAYTTEPIIRQAITDAGREQLVISTKLSHWERTDEASVLQSVEDRLRGLGTECVDICHFHAVGINSYDRVVERFYPALIKAREAGKVRFIGITEGFNSDPAHQTLSRALRDDLWDVIMVGYNILNQSAARRVIPLAREKGIGVLDMFAVRRALSGLEHLIKVIDLLIESGQLLEDELAAVGGTRSAPLSWAVTESDATSLVDAAYRFVRHEPGIDLTLSGTGDVAHLLENITSIQRPPLDQAVTDRLKWLFRHVDSVTGE